MRSLALIAGLAACLAASAVGQAPRDTIAVYAAADLTTAFPDIAAQFEAVSGTAVTLVFGATGNLALQIDLGAPADVFFAANVRFVDRLVDKHVLVAGTRILYARGRLVLVSHAAPGLRIHRLEDLLRPEVRRFAIAHPDHAPYGMAAREALRAAGLWDTLQSKLVMGENVRQALQYAQSGAVEAAIVSLSVAGVAELPVTPIDTALYQPIDQAAAVVARSPHARQAAEFIAFVTGAGWAVMERNGFVRPPAH